MEKVKTKTKVKIRDLIKDERAVYSVIEPGEIAGSGEALENGGVIIGSRNLDDIKMLSKLLIAKDFSYRIASEFSDSENEYHGREISHSYRRERKGSGADSEHYRVTLTHEDLGMVELLKKAFAGSRLALQKLDKKITQSVKSKPDNSELKNWQDAKTGGKEKRRKTCQRQFLEMGQTCRGCYYWLSSPGAYEGLRI